jgi:group I intron endonuclease
MNIDKGFGYKKSGIYCIKNTTNNKCYIGSSTHIYYRLRRHKSDLLRKAHANPILQNAYNKYGADSFVVSIIEECDPTIVLVREQYYIDSLLPVYNITKEVINNRPSLESRMKTSNTMRAKAKAGIRINCMNEDKRKQIDLYDCNCKFLKRFDSYGDAGRFIKRTYPMFSSDSVSIVVKSKFGRYKDYFLIKPNLECNADTSKEGFKLLLTDLSNTKSFEFKSASAVAKYLFCQRSAVLRALNKNRPLLKKYKIERL